MPLPSGLCETWTPTFSCAVPTSSYAFTGLAAEASTEILFALTGRQFGLCPVTIRPCRETCYGGWDGGAGFSTYPVPLLHAGSWYNITCGECTTGCSCSPVSEVVLPGPVYAVIQVKVDGIALPTGSYRLDDGRRLVRLGGSWPECNDLNLADTEPNTWSVTFQIGLPIPTLALLAHGVLTAEIAKMLACDETCGLPKQVQSLSRQGVNITFLDPNEVFANGRTGLYLPDLLIQTYNPRGLTRRAQAYDIDNPPRYT